MSKEWYQNSYRRNLVDMHIDDWNPDFLSEFDVDAYYTYLQKAEVKSAMLYLQSHVGLCYYPTASGKIHSALQGREDMMRRLAERCRAGGMDVIGYYSLIFNTYEEDRHPEWRLVRDRESGRSARQMGGRYGHCCPNNHEYRGFLKEQIREIADYFTLDGMFYDMTYWPGICYCEHCRERFEQETGIAVLPDMTDLQSETSMLFLRKRYEWIAEFAKWITDYTRSVMPEVSVSHNNAYGISGDWHEAVSEEIINCADYCAGDLYGDLYDHSFCMKYYLGATPHMPFEYMISRFPKNLKQHTVSKTVSELKQDVLLTIAHHGAGFVIDAIDPVGTVNPRVADLIGQASEAIMPYEPFLHGDVVADAAVWYSATGRYNREGQSFDSRSCACGLSKMLTTAHLPFAVIGNSKSNDLARYPLVLAPAIAGLDERHLRDIEEYVQNGGSFYFSGTGEPELLRRFFATETAGYTDAKYTYVAPVPGMEDLFGGCSQKYPLPMSWRHPQLISEDCQAEVLARLTLPYSDPSCPQKFASIHSNPPGIATGMPSVMETTVGRGRVLWSALPIELEADSTVHRRVMCNLVNRYLPTDRLSLITGAPQQVELVSFRTRESMTVSAIDLAYREDVAPLPSFAVSVALPQAPSGVWLLPEGRAIPFTYAEGWATFFTSPLNMFDMYRIDF